MIRQLQETDRQDVLSYLEEDHSLNIFIIGDIENFGITTDFQTVYAEFDEENNYQSVLLFYRKNAVFYSKKKYFNPAYIPYIKALNPTIINGAEHLVALIAPHFPNLTMKPMYFSEAKTFNEKDNYEDLDIVRLQTKKQASDLYDMLSTIEEFHITRETKESFIQSKLETLGTGPTFLVYEDDIIISTVSVTAETSKTGMVIGVATLPSKRGRGLASKLMTKLMEEYFNKGKYLCLFYDNPKAGNIYKRLGFIDIDRYAMLEEVK